MRVGIGHDTHRLIEGRPLVLGGVTVPHNRGLAAHSDGDVVLHAVADALLGAAALGDIGELFPDSDLRYYGIASAEIIRQVVTRVIAAGWRPVNVDVVVHAEQPKLGSHKQAMRQRIGQLLGLDAAAVSVKAKTGEGVGPVGRAEAISCEAVVLIEEVIGLGGDTDLLMPSRRT
ncbi:MAG: 2-C-methyl-D-erythritol 2,4-cyclodiphosphate synthase [Planctomycetes bacterium]|nr:2-C-methyl-D-erythritol 2,4-cyclodiphosphate synthase [Planctomycetota bacterium]